jgi:hypothetical protein
MFEDYFKGEMKRLSLKRYEVCSILNCTMPTLKSRLQNPQNFTIEEISILLDKGFNMSSLNDMFNFKIQYNEND